MNKTMKYNLNIFNEITRLLEFYTKLGLLPMFENDEIQSTDQIFMNEVSRDFLLKSLIENANKNDFYQHLEQEEVESMITCDFAQFAPQVRDDIGMDEIVIVPIEDVYTPPEDN